MHPAGFYMLLLALQQEQPQLLRKPHKNMPADPGKVSAIVLHTLGTEGQHLMLGILLHIEYHMAINMFFFAIQSMQ